MQFTLYSLNWMRRCYAKSLKTSSGIVPVNKYPDIGIWTFKVYTIILKVTVLQVYTVIDDMPPFSYL